MNPEIRDAEIVSPTPVVETLTPEASAPEVPKRNFKYLGAFLIGVILAGGGGFVYKHFYADVVATVNGARITKTEHEENIAMMIKTAELQGLDTTDPTVVEQIRTQSLENLIMNELLVSAAKKDGEAPQEAAVKTAYDSLVSGVGGEDALTERMASVGLTRDTLMDNISERLLVDAYIEAQTDIETIAITDEEITAYTDSIKTQGITLPPLEEIRPQIESTLLGEKQQKVVDELVTRLRSEAKIVIKGE